MRQRTLPITLTVVVTFLIAGNLLMLRWSKRLPYRQKLEEIRTAHNPNVLFIGNSLLDGRINADALQQGSGLPRNSIRAVDAALGGSDPHVQALLMDYAVQCHPNTRTLVVGFFDFQLSAEDRLQPFDLTGNGAVGIDQRFSLSEMKDVYQFNALDSIELRFLRLAPMIAYRKNAWKYVEILRRKMDQTGMPRVATNVNGRSADFSLLEAGTPEQFDREAADATRTPDDFNASYERIFAEAERKRMRVIVVVMPMSPEHREVYYSRESWSRYLALSSQHLQQRGFRVIDASSWMPNSDEFVDTLHMTPAAAFEFSYRLGHELANPMLN